MVFALSLFKGCVASTEDLNFNFDHIQNVFGVRRRGSECERMCRVLKKIYISADKDFFQL